MPVTLQDIAQQAGVSIATVSRAIRDPSTQNIPAYKKILEVANELGYTRTRSSKPRTISKILFIALRIPSNETSIKNNVNYPYTLSGFYSRFLHGVETEARKHQSSLNVRHLEVNHDIAGQVTEAIREAGAEGTVVLGGFHPDDLLALKAISPIVLLNVVQGAIDMDSVAPDDEGGMRKVVRHLIELGHRRIAFWVDKNAAGQPGLHGLRRLWGYECALKEAHLPYHRVYSEEQGDGPFSERLEKGFRAYLNDPERPTAIVCHSDTFTLSLLRLAQMHGIAVPRDLSLFGFDNLEFGAHISPSISTVDVNLEKMGQEAVNLLVKRLNDPERPFRQVTLQATLIERETSGIVQK